MHFCLHFGWRGGGRGASKGDTTLMHNSGLFITSQEVLSRAPLSDISNESRHKSYSSAHTLTRSDCRKRLFLSPQMLQEAKFSFFSCSSSIDTADDVPPYVLFWSLFFLLLYLLLLLLPSGCSIIAQLRAGESARVGYTCNNTRTRNAERKARKQPGGQPARPA